MFEDNIFAAIADGTLLNRVTSFFLREAIPGSITARNAQGHNYLEAALWIRTRTLEELMSQLARRLGLSTQEAWSRAAALERSADRVHKASEDIVRYLLTEHPVLLNQQDASGVTPLMRFSTYQPAFYAGVGMIASKVEVVPLLLQHGAKGDLQDKQGKTALHYAAEKGAVAVVAQLCKAFPRIVNVREHRGLTALHFAAQNNTIDGNTYVDKVTTLVAAKANVELADENGQLPLHHYVLANMQNIKEEVKPSGFQTKPLGFYDLLRSPFMTTVKMLRDVSYSALAHKDNQGQTALSLAFNQLTPESSPAVRAYFLTLCAFYCYKKEDGVSQADLVMSLAEQSKGLLFIYLFAHPIDYNPERQFQVAEDDPVCHLHDIMEALARLDKDKLTSLLWQTKDEAGHTLMHHIAQKRVMTFLRRYDRESLDLNAADNNGNTPLHVLLTKNIKDIKVPATQECFAYLCELGAKVNLQNQTGATPLHLAVSYGVLSYTEMLLRHGADLGIQDQAGRTPIHVDIRARQRSDTQRVSLRLLSYLALLLRHASDETICLQDKEGRTALHEAIMASDVGAVTCLLIRCPQLLNIEDKEGRTPLELAQMQQEAAAVWKHPASMSAQTQPKVLPAWQFPAGGRFDLRFINKLKTDSKEILDYLRGMASENLAEVSLQSTESVNKRVKDYIFEQDMIFLQTLPEESPLEPTAPGSIHFHRYDIRHPTREQMDRHEQRCTQYHIEKKAFESTRAMLSTDLTRLARLDNLYTGDVQASSRAAAGATHAPAVPSSSSSVLFDRVLPVPQDNATGSFSSPITLMSPPSSSPSSQLSCSKDVTWRP